MKKKHTIHNINRLLLLVLAILMIIVIKVPMWRIDLTAPQYPEGLQLLIYPNHLGGNVEIISGLNHYIGMKALHTEDFFEFSVLPGILIAFSVLLVLVSATNRKWMLRAVFVLFFVFGIVAMIDFWKWEYNYGHNLNPDAPIIVPGMAYQPPLIGFKQLLNFGAYSIPAIGGWLFAGVGLCLLIMNAFEYYWMKKIKTIVQKLPVTVIIFIGVVFISSCNNSTSPIILGKDNCSFCKMPVSDARFGAELITGKGKVYKFDDAHCLLGFLHSDEIKDEKNPSIYFVDFSGSHELLPVAKALFLQSDILRSPMNGNIAAFAHADSLQMALQKFPGTVLHWEELNKQ
jgi:copper chaperone NosL